MTVWHEGYGRRILQSVDSTLSEAARQARQLSGPEWILAHEQTQARGRRGRAWAMPAGNFAASLVIPLTNGPRQAALRSFIAALAVRAACVSATGRDVDFQLKWPNDVLLRGKKLAGILLESVMQGGTMSHVVIGIGVNLRKAPKPDRLEKNATPPVSLFQGLAVDITPEDYLDLLAAAFERYDAQFRSIGFAPIRTEWLAHAARLGEEITARTMSETYQGKFIDVDGQGQLVLETGQGRVHIPAGEVYF